MVISRISGHREQPAVILSWSGHRRGRSRVESGPLEIAWCYSLLRRCDSGASGATGADVFIIAAEWGRPAACTGYISQKQGISRCPTDRKDSPQCQVREGEESGVPDAFG